MGIPLGIELELAPPLVFIKLDKSWRFLLRVKFHTFLIFRYLIRTITIEWLMCTFVIKQIDVKLNKLESKSSFWLNITPYTGIIKRSYIYNHWDKKERTKTVCISRIQSFIDIFAHCAQSGLTCWDEHPRQTWSNIIWNNTLFP